jgi:hypothetical protein
LLISPFSFLDPRGIDLACRCGFKALNENAGKRLAFFWRQTKRLLLNLLESWRHVQMFSRSNRQVKQREGSSNL